MAHKLQDDLPEGLSVATEVDTYEESSDSEENSEGDDHNSDSDVILAEFGDSDEEEDNISMNTTTEGFCDAHTTRTGRRVTLWQNRFGAEWLQ